MSRLASTSRQGICQLCRHTLVGGSSLSSSAPPAWSSSSSRSVSPALSSMFSNRLRSRRFSSNKSISSILSQSISSLAKVSLQHRSMSSSPRTEKSFSPVKTNPPFRSTRTTSTSARYWNGLQHSFGTSMGRRGIVIQATPPKNPPEDFEPVEEGDDTIELTDNAIKQIVRAQTQAKNLDLALRVAVESGGCHGYQYKMQVTDQPQLDDYLFQPTSSSAKLIIDSASLPLLSGSTIDYATELIGSSFRIEKNPHASDKGGCGCGVSWELKE